VNKNHRGSTNQALSGKAHQHPATRRNVRSCSRPLFASNASTGSINLHSGLLRGFDRKAQRLAE
jgi:hypothetical protein